MRRPLALFFALLLLAACNHQEAPKEVTLEVELHNPLFADWYFNDLVDRMVDLEIQEDPLLADPLKRKIAEETRKQALENAKEARKIQRKGFEGSFQPLLEFAKGDVLYLGNTIYLSPEFNTVPGPSLHIFLSTVVDPRTEGSFPDPTALDLGPIKSPYGAHSYSVPPVDNPILYRSIVLYDTSLERLYGLAQLSPPID